MPAPSDSSAPSASSVPSAGDITISGTIDAGVEPGCILLDKHLLIIKDDAQKSIATAGATVTVTGHTVKGMMTTCMQGTPFLVTSIQVS
ncbi:hypothetical protein [Winogradskya consettensis]|uniref:hypothetical protein n=1 Tax=Winogradskya consettensis TaxID=113560 RepID=UPI001BB3576B|nr:hypothetical protein [Actinoplanes consettensis]